MDSAAETSLRSYTTFRLGGPCAEIRTAANAEEARQAILAWHERGIPWRVMGGGSNLLVADAGIPQAVLRIHADFLSDNIPWRPGEVSIPAAAPLDAVAEAAAKHGLAGLGFANGIPGTLGGAVSGNAGAFGEQIGGIVTEVEALTPEGKIITLPASALAFDYRRSAVAEQNIVLLSVRLRLTAGDPDELLARREEILAIRKTKHPDVRTQRTAGSFFKNLPPAHPGGHRRPAAVWLEAIGAKTMRVGGASVFPNHANILMADENATAADVAGLARQLQDAVAARFGVRLEPEVRYWGFNTELP